MSDLVTADVRLWPWRPIYWEPVSGTGERIMVGVVHGYADEFRATRTIRKDVLECLFGKSAGGLLRLIDEGLRLYQAAARASGGIDGIRASLLGLQSGEMRRTEARSSTELLETACLLCSSLVNLDRLDEADENDEPQAEEVSRRFSTEVRAEVLRLRPDLQSGFGKSATLIDGGQQVRFGFASSRVLLHYTVLNTVRHSASVRDARAKFWELQRAREVTGVAQAALIAGVPRNDDPTIGRRQKEQLLANKAEIESEADAVGLRWYGVYNAQEGASKTIELAA